MSTRTCTHCGSADTTRSRRRWWERLIETITRLSVSPRRCYNCGRRFWEC
jgi:hypothetical protein